MKPNHITINNRRIGEAYPPYVIAELSANHNGLLQNALDSLLAAKKSGASAIKLQTYSPDTMTINHDADDFKIKGGLWDNYTLYDLYQQAQTPFAWHKELFEHAKHLDITCFSTPFDESAVDLLEDLNTPAYKIASFEVTDLSLIQYVASTNKPIILSTGMADLEEITEAVDMAYQSGCKELALLHCISGYPTPVEQSNLLTISDMKSRFSCPIGLSDHSLSHTSALAAVALGASIIEKHFTLKREDKGLDAAFSIEPKELKQLCQMAKETWITLGKAGYERKPAEIENLKFRRSLYFIKDIQANEIVTDQHIRRIRPGYGLPPKYFSHIIGQKVSQNVKAGTATHWGQFDPSVQSQAVDLKS